MYKDYFNYIGAKNDDDEKMVVVRIWAYLFVNNTLNIDIRIGQQIYVEIFLINGILNI